jgi:hypothetical protein
MKTVATVARYAARSAAHAQNPAPSDARLPRPIEEIAFELLMIAKLVRRNGNRDCLIAFEDVIQHDRRSLRSRNSAEHHNSHRCYTESQGHALD